MAKSGQRSRSDKPHHPGRRMQAPLRDCIVTVYGLHSNRVGDRRMQAVPLRDWQIRTHMTHHTGVLAARWRLLLKMPRFTILSTRSSRKSGIPHTGWSLNIPGGRPLESRA